MHDQLKERLIGKDLTELLQGATTESGANTSTEYTPSIAITELPETPKHLRFKTSVTILNNFIEKVERTCPSPEEGL